MGRGALGQGIWKEALGRRYFCLLTLSEVDNFYYEREAGGRGIFKKGGYEAQCMEVEGKKSFRSLSFMIERETEKIDLGC